MEHILDRPAWSALSTRHAGLALGGPLARRYPALISPLAGLRDDRPESLAALALLPHPGETIVVVQTAPITIPDGLCATAEAVAVQMMATQPFAALQDARIEPLGEADAPEMLALATLTRPGPFSLKAAALGQFWGIRRDGRLAAMAGERMKQPEFAEVSGVCTHPDFRGNGYARRLSVFVAGRISARGERPYLHAYATNSAAIALYESIGFALRCRLNVAALTPAASDPTDGPPAP